MAITKREVFTKALGMEGFSAEEKEVFEKAIKALDKKASTPTKAQKEAEGIRANILALLADGRARTATEIGAEIGISCQKASAMLKPYVDNGTVTKVVGKGKNPNTFVVAE